MKEIPGFDVELAQSMNYILGSPLAKKAFVCPPFYNFTNILTEIIQGIDRLADNCHMPEFTNHALPHICSIVKRASEWGESDGWLEYTTSQEAGYLLIALLIHDIGMLSQDSNDIPNDEKFQYMKGLSDMSNWVRRTHVIRIEKLVKDMLSDYMENEMLSDHLDVIIGMAQSHAKWPWDPHFVTARSQIAKVGLKEERIGAFNAVIAVCDLLDEDSNRCDTLTLIKHHYGTIENKTHWIRHAITKRVEGVKAHRIIVRFRRLPVDSPYLDMLYRTLRNHYRLVKLYQEKLEVIHGEIWHLDFDPSDGIPDEKDEISEKLGECQSMPEFQYDLIPYLMATFMDEAKNHDGGDDKVRKKLDEIGMETMNLSELNEFFHPGVLLYPEERVIFGKGKVEEKLRYAHDLAEKAYVNGDIEKLRHICGAVLDILEPHTAEPDQIYWAITYLLIYEKGSMDFEAAKRMHQNFICSSLPGDCGIDISAANIEPYQRLLDVLLCFLESYVTGEAIKKYYDYLMKCDYTILQDDFATLRLVWTVVGMFWFWDGQSGKWCEISEQIQNQVKKERLIHMLGMQRRCLKLQDKMLVEGGKITDEELMNVDYPILARAWKHFWEAAWEELEKDNNQMISCGEKNPDLFGSIQGLQNMTNVIMEWSGIDRESQMHKYRDTGVRRYHRNAGENQRSEFWHARESAIESSLAQSRKGLSSGKAANIRRSVIRLVALRKLEALQYWNIGEYLESVRNETCWLHSMAVYENQQGDYRGIAEYLPETVISSVQSMDSDQFTKDEMKQIITKMYYHFPEGYEKIISFLTSTPQRCIWSYGVQLLEYLVADLKGEQLTRLLKWLILYDDFIQTQKHHYNLGEYQFLEQVVYCFTDEDWEIVHPIITRMYQNYFWYRPNKKFAQKVFDFMPYSFCEEALEMVEKWSDEKIKRHEVYEISIILNKRWGNKINACLHQFIRNCQQKDPCRVYQELDSLIDVDNLLRRNNIDTEGICSAVKVMIECLKNMDLSGYDSRIIQELSERFTNQNWRLMPEEKVLWVIRSLCSVLKDKRNELSGCYFMDFCGLLREVGRMAETRIQQEITTFFINEYIISDIGETGNSWLYDIDGPLNTVHLNLLGKGSCKQGVFSVLVSCLTEIPDEYHLVCIRWTLKCLEKDNGVLYYYGMLLISYYYFRGKAETRMRALCGLCYIRGSLDAGGEYFEIRLQRVFQAWDNLKEADQWFGEKGFVQIAEEDREYQEMFWEPVLALKKKSVNPAIRHWDSLVQG
ncbi:MAG: hypothetical protein HFG51_08205 [Lachnospiraceae bacterium]|nr:hypothetical protein [Lachnospiraceae bacterium]